MTYKKVPRIKRDKNGEYPKSFKQKIDSAQKLKERKYMIATVAEHLMGDISREITEEVTVENLCYVYKETEEYYVGAWITGLGFFDVAFPKETTRELTQEEKERFNKVYIQLASNPPQKLNIE